MASTSASGIYRITCIANGRIYIGSAVNIQSRWRIHLHHLRQNKHHSITMQRAWQKYGEEAFTFEVIELVLAPFLLEREQHWLDTLQPFSQHGFNTDRIAGSRYGYAPSPETREKLRKANLGKTYSEETKRKHSEEGKLRTQSAASREKIRLANLGQKRSDAARESMRNAQLGKKQSEETKERRRIAKLGYTPSADTRAKISASNVESNAWRMQRLIATSPSGETFTIHGVGRFCKEHGLNHSALIQVAKGKTPHHKGWTARYVD